MQPAIDLDLETPISAPRERVWEALLHDTGIWFGGDGSESPGKGFALEPWDRRAVLPESR